MSLWGPAAEAEIKYRQAELERAWGGRRAKDRSGRARRAAERRTDRGTGRGTERATERPARAEQIREGLAGMRPAGAQPGLYA
ncbi:hypothetical protein ACFQHV_03410 [Promicromonospora thailandica]|uniref:Uncharacterized protein n=1 Tax=Promicromonospora thailandica TaxID=765201 RepID=A0A9X2JTD7_9MICO|nr:hypothetical protein [Promicromonospora thailandica]MCP2263325.1 hypothetical protein [Promicromonospora thailandica]BFF19526.1 hypothetical protein GCM10025730_30470 [Promicromonospora thailandica]